MMKYSWNQTVVNLMLISVVSLSCSGCLSVLFTGSSDLEKPAPKYPNVTKESFCPKARIYTVRGFLDVFSTGMIGLADKIEQELKTPAQSISHIEEKKLSAYLIKRYQSDSYRCQTPIVLIGHSYGADDQVMVAKRLNKAHIPVALIIDLDHTKTQTIPANVKSYYNLSSGSSVVQTVVPWGCPMTAASTHTKMKSVDLAKQLNLPLMNHFNIDKLPEVQNYILQILKSEHIGEGGIYTHSN